MATPVLVRREDIWRYFPVNSVQLGRGANGADRHGIEWHRKKLTDMAASRGIRDIERFKAELTPEIIAALSASPSWVVEAPPPGTQYIAVIAMKFRRNNATRRNNAAAAPRVNATRRWNRSPPKKTKTPTPPANTRRRNSPPKVNSTRKNEVYSAEQLVRKARAIINKASDDNIEKLSTQFVSLVPKKDSDFKELIEMMFEMILDTQAYHPLLIRILQKMDEVHDTRPYPKKPSEAIAKLLYKRAKKEPIYVELEMKANNSNNGLTNSAETRIMNEKRFFRSCMMFVGYMYREGMLKFKKLKKIVKAKMETIDDEDYRIQDTSIQTIVFVLIRAGKALEEEGGDEAEFVEKVKKVLKKTAESVSRHLIKSLCLEFLDAAENDYKIKAGMPWTVGAPKGDIRKAKAAAAPAVAGLGEDIAELWRRFPLDVKEVEAGKWVVKFHNKKLQERYERESSRYKSAANFQSALTKHILDLIDNSKYWKRGAPMAGAIVTVVSK